MSPQIPSPPPLLITNYIQRTVHGVPKGPGNTSCRIILVHARRRSNDRQQPQREYKLLTLRIIIIIQFSCVCVKMNNNEKKIFARDNDYNIIYNITSER